MFPGASSDIGSDKFEPAYYLLDKHRFSNFEVRPFRFYFIFWPQTKIGSLGPLGLRNTWRGNNSLGFYQNLAVIDYIFLIEYLKHRQVLNAKLKQ